MFSLFYNAISLKINKEPKRYKLTLRFLCPSFKTESLDKKHLVYAFALYVTSSRNAPSTQIEVISTII